MAARRLPAAGPPAPAAPAARTPPPPAAGGRARGPRGQFSLARPPPAGAAPPARRGRGQPVPAGRAEQRRECLTTGLWAVGGPGARASERRGLFLAHDHAGRAYEE